MDAVRREMIQGHHVHSFDPSSESLFDAGGYRSKRPGKASPWQSLPRALRLAFRGVFAPPPLKSWSSKGPLALGGVSGRRPEKPGTGFRGHGFAPVTAGGSERDVGNERRS